MRQACECIHARGGVAAANVFTKITLALFDQYDWYGLPYPWFPTSSSAPSAGFKIRLRKICAQDSIAATDPMADGVAWRGAG